MLPLCDMQGLGTLRQRIQLRNQLPPLPSYRRHELLLLRQLLLRPRPGRLHHHAPLLQEHFHCLADHKERYQFITFYDVPLIVFRFLISLSIEGLPIM